MLEIRSAKEADMEVVRNMYLEEVEAHAERAKNFAEDLIHRFKTMLALEGERLVGTLSWDTRGGYDDGVIELVSIGVINTFKRRGIATKLIESLIDKASEFYTSRGYRLRVILLFMERKNEVARKFYKKLGFSEVSKVPGLYPQDDGVIWIRHL